MIVVLGSTGSIGVNTLKIAQQFDIAIEALVAGKNISLLNEQIKVFQPRYVVISDTNDIKFVKHHDVRAGNEAILELICKCQSKVVVNALVGFAGLAPTIEAIKCGKRVALANKESLVTAGMFLDTTMIDPIDSEHFALWYLVQEKAIDSMIVTASGGSFRDFPLERLANVSIKEALNHPNWSMGNKITIDSATMTNKLFEILEAYWLFGIKKLDAVIETKSLIHAIINFKDGSSTAHLAHADMRLPIAYALLKEISEPILQPIDLVSVGSLEFRKIDNNRYPIWEIKEDLLNNPHLGVTVNAANEVAVQKFLHGQIPFLDIARITLDAYRKYFSFKPTSIEDIFAVDAEIRACYV